MIRRPPRSTQGVSSAASDVYKRQELGDVLLHVIFQSQISSEKNDFDINDVINDINEKLIDRHPHVFEKSVLSNDKISNELWEVQKYKKKGRKSRLDGVPKI